MVSVVRYGFLYHAYYIVMCVKIGMPAHMHVRTHTHTNAHTHTHSHLHTCTHTHARTHAVCTGQECILTQVLSKQVAL